MSSEGREVVLIASSINLNFSRPPYDSVWNSNNQSINLRLLVAWQNEGQLYTKVIHIVIVQELCV